MAQTCPICKKGSQMEWKRKLLRGNYNPTHKVRKYPNLQWTRLYGAQAKKYGFKEGQRFRACTKCRKALLRE